MDLCLPRRGAGRVMGTTWIDAWGLVSGTASAMPHPLHLHFGFRRWDTISENSPSRMCWRIRETGFDRKDQAGQEANSVAALATSVPQGLKPALIPRHPRHG